MAKVDLDLVKYVLQKNELEPRRVASIIEDLEQESKALQQENQAALRVKKQFVMIVSDPEKVLAGKELTGWIVQIPEEEDPSSAIERIQRGAHDFNASPKGRRMPVESVGEACEVVAARFFKEHNVWIKTKEAHWLIPTDNKIPRLDPGKDL